MTKLLTIGARDFPTKKAAKDFYREILYRYQRGERVSKADADDLHMLWLIHPEAHDKSGVGVAGFKVDRDPLWGTTQCFHIIRKDGTSTDFSFSKSIDGPNPLRDRAQALREAIAPQIIAFKRVAFDGKVRVTCAASGALITYKEARVDHESPRTFQRLLRGWLGRHELLLQDIAIVERGDEAVASALADESQRESWVEFHRVEARLRVVATIPAPSTC